ncbi:hypothetical protein C0J52_24461 [Blattella germanica]|nr:hypothetical protein C0J52_24461 [Blattella germanica]
MPFMYTHIEYAVMIYVNGFCDGNALNAVAEYRRRFPTRRTLSSRVFVRAFQSVRDSGSLPSAAHEQEELVQRIHAAAEFIRGEQVRVGNATRAVHSRAAGSVTAEGRVFENVLQYAFIVDVI